MIELLAISAVFVCSAGAAAGIQISALRLLMRALQSVAPASGGSPGEQP